VWVVFDLTIFFILLWVVLGKKKIKKLIGSVVQVAISAGLVSGVVLSW
jgi:hypothetical protein